MTIGPHALEHDWICGWSIWNNAREEAESECRMKQDTFTEIILFQMPFTDHFGLLLIFAFEVELTKSKRICKHC